MKSRILIAAFLSLALFGCHVGPEYVPPSPEVPEDWKNPSFTPNAEPCDAWWEVFNDPVLNELEEQALSYSPTLEQAIARVNEEYALLRVVEANNYPFLTFNPANMVIGTLISPQSGASMSNLIPTGGNVTPTVIGGGGTTPLLRTRVQTTTMPFTASYDVDLWGKREDSIMAALARAQSSQEGYNSVWLKLTADVAAAYFQMRGLNLQIEILTLTKEARQQEVEINDSRYKAGLINESDVTLARVEVANAEFDILDSERLYAIQEDTLAVLIGEYPSSFSLSGAQPIREPPPTVPTGLPSQLLLRRPDISEAERTLAAYSADVRYYYADFFPTLSLTGTLGYSSPTIANLFQWRARLWSWAVSSASTLFDAGQKCAALDAAKARYMQAVANYEQTVLVAFQEVEDSLASLRLYASQYEAGRQGETSAQASLDISRSRYTKGLENYLDVVVNERTLLVEQLKTAQVLADEYIKTVALIQALGGGWGCDCADSSQ